MTLLRNGTFFTLIPFEPCRRFYSIMFKHLVVTCKECRDIYDMIKKWRNISNRNHHFVLTHDAYCVRGWFSESCCHHHYIPSSWINQKTKYKQTWQIECVLKNALALSWLHSTNNKINKSLSGRAEIAIRGPGADPSGTRSGQRGDGVRAAINHVDVVVWSGTARR